MTLLFTSKGLKAYFSVEIIFCFILSIILSKIFLFAGTCQLMRAELAHCAILPWLPATNNKMASPTVISGQKPKFRDRNPDVPAVGGNR